MLLGSVQCMAVKLQILILLHIVFLADLIELEKENKFRYVALRGTCWFTLSPRPRAGALLGCRWVREVPTR